MVKYTKFVWIFTARAERSPTSCALVILTTSCNFQPCCLLDAMQEVYGGKGGGGG